MTAHPQERRWRAPAIVFLIALAAYGISGGGKVVFGDGLEFVAAAACHGVAHPPGYPLLTLLLLIPAATPFPYIASMLVCAALAAATAAFATVIASQLAGEEHNLGALESSFPVLAGLAVAFSASLWPQATHVEAYALNAALVSALIVAARPMDPAPLGVRRRALVAALLGLALCNHTPSLALAPLVAWRLLQRPISPLAFLAFPVGLLPWLYLPIAASTNPAVNWGAADTVPGFLWMARGGDYGRLYLLSIAGQPLRGDQLTSFWLLRGGEVLRTLGGQLLGGDPSVAYYGESRLAELMGEPIPSQNPIAPPAIAILGLVVIAIAAIGFVQWRRRGAWIGASTMALAAGAQIGFLFLYAIPDGQDYLPGAYLPMVPLILAGTRVALGRLGDRLGYRNEPALYRRLAFALGAVVLVAFLSNWKLADRRPSAWVDRWIAATLEALPQDALVITHGDYDTYGLWYAQQALHLRPDLLVVAGNFLREDWYARSVPTAAPDEKGRLVIPEPGDFRRFTLQDHLSMLQRGVVAPNLGKVPVWQTIGSGGPPLVSPGRMRLGRQLVTIDDPAILAMVRTNAAFPPLALAEIVPDSPRPQGVAP